jgi:hypothetical protein
LKGSRSAFVAPSEQYAHIYSDSFFISRFVSPSLVGSPGVDMWRSTVFLAIIGSSVLLLTDSTLPRSAVGVLMFSVWYVFHFLYQYRISGIFIYFDFLRTQSKENIFRGRYLV